MEKPELMRLFVSLLAIFGLSCAIYFMFSNKPTFENKQSVQNPYLELRKQALSITPEQLHLQLSQNNETVFGAILEFGTKSGSATIISFSTGDASMYTSGGGGIIGGTTHKNVSQAAINFVLTAQNYFHKMPKSNNLTIAKADYIKFYILTNKAVYSFEDKESNITDRNSIWAPLFYKGNDLITQLRLIGNE